MQNDYATQLIAALKKPNPVLFYEDAFKDIPYSKVNIRPAGLPYSLWEQCFHLRTAQHNMLLDCKEPGHKALKWPDEFWPKENNPSENEWNKCLEDIKNDREEMISLIEKSKDKLLDPLPGNAEKTIFSRALAMARHNSYHSGEVLVLRRLLGLWK